MSPPTDEDRKCATPQEIEAARSIYGCDDVEIDDGAQVSVADDGVWVQAWVWVNNDEAADEENPDDGTDKCAIAGLAADGC